MRHELPPLPYGPNDLSPHLSQETLEFHYGKHHKGYVEKLNSLVASTTWENSTLEEIVKKAEGDLFHNAAQVYNHSFYWKCLAPGAGGEAWGKIQVLIQQSFGSFAAFKKKFTDEANNLFGSGWVWLVLKKDGSLGISAMGNADNPLVLKGHGETQPLLTCDVWEHAYYIDYRNKRQNYVEAFWNLVNWEWVNNQLR